MACLTNTDLRNMALYTLNQRKVRRRNELLKNAPHIGSHTTTRVWRCTNEYVYRDPIELDARAQERYECEEGVSNEEWLFAVNEVAETAIVCDWRFNETGCNTISCNPYYPEKGVCQGFHKTTGEKEQEGREETFAFVTAHKQRVNACQPICYDEDRKKDTYVGMTLLYANKDRTCFATDPELLAFYLDPYRRVTADGGERILEKSAFYVGKEYIGATGAPVVVAKIDQAYCEQYGLDYVTERYDDNGNGETLYYGRCKTDRNEGGFFSLSTWFGDTLTKTYNFGRANFIDLVKRTGNGKGASATAKTIKLKENVLKKEQPTLHYLTNNQSWRSHIDRTKRQLPFPLKLGDLGLDRGNRASDSLLWTDEYSFLDDGRNDVYGGRLVEKPRGINRPFHANNGNVWEKPLGGNRQEKGFFSPPVTKVKDNGEKEKDNITDNDKRICDAENKFINNLALSLTGLKESVAGTSYEIMVNQIYTGMVTDTLGNLLAETKAVHRSSGQILFLRRALKLLLKRTNGFATTRLSNRAVGLVATQTAIKARIESRVVEVLTSRLKLPFRILSRGVNALSFIQLFGAAVDLFTAFVYDPYKKYEHYVSDRVLRAMAYAELVATQRMTGRQRLTLDPFEWMANTRFLDSVKDSTYDMLLGMTYTRGRRVNSEGSLVYWYEHGGDKRRFNQDEPIVTKPGRLVRSFSKEETRHLSINDRNLVDLAVSPTGSSFTWFALAFTIVFFCLAIVFIDAFRFASCKTKSCANKKNVSNHHRP